MFNFIRDIFEKTAARFPDRVALADQERSFTFAQLKALSQSIAAAISADTPYIGVMAHRDAFAVPMFFGAAYAGACYVPIDPGMSVSKMGKIIANAGITQVLSFSADDREKVSQAGAALLLLDETLPAAHDGAALCGNPELYVIYTSGSTGTPKGIVKSHTAMRSFTDAYTKEFSFDETTVIGNQTPFCFDASAKDIYLMAACGARLEILPTELFAFPVGLMDYMNERKVNFICWVPSALSIVTAMNIFSEVKPNDLKRVFFVGEVFSPKHLNKWIQALPHVEYVNLYGSSEICGISCYCRIRGEVDPKAAIPIGTALSNCDVKLICEGGAVQAPGVTGEIYVASPALADRYFADEEKTNAGFVRADFGDGEKRYYRTGDLARYDEEGQLVFVSRSDHQIKHMGHRIELGEIEAAGACVQGIEKCCCVFDPKRNRIFLFAQLQPGAELDSASIRAALRMDLPDYMIPHRVKIMERIPLNPNGKFDRQALQEEIS